MTDRICSVENCGLPHDAKGLCRKHYARAKRGTAEHAVRSYNTEFVSCAVDDCANRSITRGYCKTHVTRLYKGTDLSTPVEFKRPGEWRAWYKNNHGYIVRVRTNQSKQEFQLQHRKVMEETLGRALYDGENVHHKNGVRDDNRIENLELWVTKQPKGQRPADLLEWADEIIARYRK